MQIFDLTYKEILNSVTFEIKPNKINCLIGENGSGKSTILKIVSGYYKGWSGEILINGVSLKKLGIARLRETRSVLSQIMDFSPYITCRDYLDVTGYQLEKDSFSLELVEKFEIKDLLCKPMHRCSGGEIKKISFLRVVLQGLNYQRLNHPYYIFLDEPFAALDMKSAKIMEYALNTLKERGFTLLVVEHDVNHACDYADQVILLGSGKIIASGEAIEVLNTQNLFDTFNVRFNITTNLNKMWFQVDI